MKEGWKVVKIKDICEASNGLWKGKKPPYKKIAVIRNTNFSKYCKLKLDNVEYIDVEERQYISRKLEYGDIIIEKSGGSDKQPVGRPILFNVIEGDFSYSNFTSRLRINDSGSVDSHYLHKVLYHLYLEGATFNLQSNTTGIHNLDLKGYLELEIPLPPLPEQHRIVKKLDAAFEKIDAMKAKAEKNIENAKALFQQTLAEELEPKEGWVEKKLGDFAYMKAGDFVKASDIHEAHEYGLFPCYGGNGLRGFVKEPNQEGDYCIIGRQGALCGCINRASGTYRTTEHAVIVKPYSKIPTTLVYYLLVNLKLNQYSTGAAQPGLSVKNIAENVMINVPPLPEQQQIVTKLDNISAKCKKLEKAERKTIAECDALKQAILRQAFNGEL